MELKRNPVWKKGKRNVFCCYYSDCLDEVIKKDWKDWVCQECPYQTNVDNAPELPYGINHSVAYYEIMM